MMRAVLIMAALFAADPAPARCVGTLGWPCAHVECLRHHSGSCFPVTVFRKPRR